MRGNIRARDAGGRLDLRRTLVQLLISLPFNDPFWGCTGGTY
jgi:hypothetical protein